MRIEFTGRHVEVPEPLRRLAERKLAKLSRFLPRITWAHVTLSSNRHREAVEVTVNSPRGDLVAREATGDVSSSLIAAFDKLEHQARHQAGKRLDRKRRPSTLRALAGGLAAEPPPDGRRVIRRGRLAVKPMTLEEAVLEVDRREEGFLVFRDAATERVHVLYRRKDGHLGLIEPGA
jgi:putative sigma-54 modulation protein